MLRLRTWAIAQHSTQQLSYDLFLFAVLQPTLQRAKIATPAVCLSIVWQIIKIILPLAEAIIFFFCTFIPLFLVSLKKFE